MQKLVLIVSTQLIVTVTFAFSLQNSNYLQNPRQDAVIQHYGDRYELTDPFVKRVNNSGNGFEPLYGTRNFRAVLKGVVYRGGANNYYHRSDKRDNSNPLPADGLKNLCKEGFGQTVYLYPTNFRTAATNTSCAGPDGLANQITYSQESPHEGKAAEDRVLKMVYEKLHDSQDSRPIYLHCWNGWHASGYISAVILRQFCDLGAEDAVTYWNKNTDGVNVGERYDEIRAQIRAFVPSRALQISPDLKQKICFAKTW